MTVDQAGALYMTPETQSEKEKINWTPSEFKNSHASKDILKKVKRQLIKCEKMFANHISDKRVVSRIYKELLQVNN